MIEGRETDTMTEKMEESRLSKDSIIPEPAPLIEELSVSPRISEKKKSVDSNQQRQLASDYLTQVHRVTLPSHSRKMMPLLHRKN